MAPKSKLPKFEGEEVKARELTMTGSVATAMGIDDLHQLDDEIVVIGTMKVKRIGHERKGDPRLLTRVETATAVDLFIVSDNVDALDLLQRARAEREAALDELLGRQKLPMDDENAATDDKLGDLLREEAAKDAEAEIQAQRPQDMTDEEWEASAAELRKARDDNPEGEPDGEPDPA